MKKKPYSDSYPKIKTLKFNKNIEIYFIYIMLKIIYIPRGDVKVGSFLKWSIDI